MSESNLPPEQWRPLFDKAGIEFGYRPLATRAGMTHTRVHRLIRGGGTTSEAIQQVADALGVRASKVRELRGEPAVDIEPFTLPDDAGRLNDKERDVIRAMVRALLDAREQGNAVEATTKQDASSEADEDEKTGAAVNPDDLIEPHPGSGLDVDDPQSAVDLAAGGWRRGGGESETRRRRREQDEAAERGDV
ncbi:hypothetical protein QSJ18_18420 [Gordonia sp. ABSL1-1]|uniref:hypothetical protein n=1 Tax=Gordonia sp. ABSL1-1 TaxID=3053923 RepID=UPI0025724E1B|nr:hypothetical protein [Gordonia sp. ABSL1-1]MDL9938726.1 hypothetical protein [Gordonia sp. ABSL1-1]